VSVDSVLSVHGYMSRTVVDYDSNRNRVEISFVTYYFMRSRLDTNKIKEIQYQSAPHKISVIQKIFSTPHFLHFR
jgi:hypothetical protein